MITASFLGQTSTSREYLIQHQVDLATEATRKLTGVDPPWKIARETFDLVVDGKLRFLNDIGAQYGYTYSRKELEDRLIHDGYTPGGEEPERLAIIEESVTATLTTAGLSAYPDRVESLTIDELNLLSNNAFHMALKTGKQYGYVIGFNEVKNALLARGYQVADQLKPPVVPAPFDDTTLPPPIVAIPIIPAPFDDTTLPPPIVAIPTGDNSLLWILAIGAGLLLFS